MTSLAPWERPVSYGAVGATKSTDLLQFPPAGFRPSEHSARIGHGNNRFEHAWTSALTWGIQRGAGFRIEKTDSPALLSELTYVPVTFDETGAPVESSLASPTGETSYGPDGTPFLAPGDTVWLHGALGVRAPVRVVYVIDEPRRKGFAYGTLPGHPESGEESFIVDQRDDGTVWLTVTQFSRPSNGWWWSVYPVLRAFQAIYMRRYLRALAGPTH